MASSNRATGGTPMDLFWAWARIGNEVASIVPLRLMQTCLPGPRSLAWRQAEMQRMMSEKLQAMAEAGMALQGSWWQGGLAAGLAATRPIARRTALNHRRLTRTRRRSAGA